MPTPLVILSNTAIKSFPAGICNLLIALALFSSCAAPIKAIKNNSDVLRSMLCSPDSVSNLAGQISAFDGEIKIKSEFAVTDSPEQGLLCRFFDPFGGTAVELKGRDNTTLISGNTEMVFDNDNPVDIKPFFYGYPFTFSHLRRILTGRLPFTEYCSKMRDDAHYETSREVSISINDSILLIASNRLRGNTLNSITIKPVSKETWQLEMSRFNDGYAKEITFRSRENKYFNIKLRKIQTVEEN
jgi:hypothetical protein